MDERRATHLGAGYGLLSETELEVVPIIAKCLEGMKVAADAVNAKNVGTRSWQWTTGDKQWLGVVCRSRSLKAGPPVLPLIAPHHPQDSQVLIELHKSGFARPGDVEFEDFSQPMNRVPSDSSLGTPSDGRPELRGTSRSRAKRWPFGKKNKVGAGALSVEGWV